MKFASHASAEFWSIYDKLPPQVRQQADKQYEIFGRDPYHPSLRLKRVGLFWSVRISRSYRALARRRGNDFFWFWIGSHSEYDDLITRL